MQLFRSHERSALTDCICVNASHCPVHRSNVGYRRESSESSTTIQKDLRTHISQLVEDQWIDHLTRETPNHYALQAHTPHRSPVPLLWSLSRSIAFRENEHWDDDDLRELDDDDTPIYVGKMEVGVWTPATTAEQARSMSDSPSPSKEDKPSWNIDNGNLLPNPWSLNKFSRRQLPLHRTPHHCKPSSTHVLHGS